MSTLKKILKWLGIALLVVLLAGFTLYLVYLRPVMEQMKQTSTVQYDRGLTLVLGGGGNSGILVSDSLVLVIDTKMDEAAEALAQTVKSLAGGRPIIVVNTHIHPDHSGGNQFYQDQRIIAGGNYSPEEWLKEANKETMPTEWLKDKMDVIMDDDTATLFNLPYPAHTASDVFVYLHKRRMMFCGDVVLNKQAPALMGAAGDPKGYLTAFDMLQERFDIRTVVPGHGPTGGTEVIDNFRTYFQDMQTAAHDPAQQESLEAKYKDWTQVPLVMSPGATIRVIREKGE